MVFRVIITNNAEQDLREIVPFIKKENRKAAEQYGYRLIDKALSLSGFLERGRIVPEL